MKTFIRTLIALLIVSPILLLGKKTTELIRKKEKAELVREQFPFTALKTLTGKSLTEITQNPAKPFVLIFFHPECGYCSNQSEYLAKSGHELEGSPILMVSSAEEEEIRTYANDNQLNELSWIHWVQDTDKSIKEAMNVKTVPAIFIYDEQAQLVQYYKGETKIEAIIEKVKRNEGLNE